MENKSSRMGTMPINKLLLKISVPIMFSMLVHALYNIVDTFFVSKFSEDAVTAIGYAFPIQMLMISIGVGTGIGLNSLISRRLGEKKNEEALKTAENGIFLAFVSWIAFGIFGVFGLKHFLGIFSAEKEIIEMTASYLRITTIFSFGVFGQIAFEKIMQGSGNTMYNMIIQLVGSIINIILDPLMIFGIGPFPQMGISGAAWATIIGQTVAMLLAFILNQRYNKELKLRFKGFKPDKTTIKNIYAVGLPSIIMQSIGSMMVVTLNMILGFFSQTAVAFLAIYFKIQSFVFMPVFGLTNGVVAIVGYNFGAKNKKRIYQTLASALLYALIIMISGMTLFMVFPKQILGIFNASKEMLSIGVPALRIISISFSMAAIGIVISTVFQAIGNGILSLFMSITRQIVVLIPMAYVLAKTRGLQAVWWSFPISELVSLILCLILFLWVNKRYFIPLSPIDNKKQ